MGEDSGRSINVEEMFKKYLEICNKALSENKDRFPYKFILDAAKEKLSEKTVSIELYDDRPKLQCDVKMVDNQIDVVECKEINAQNLPWQVKLSYLQRVIENPDEFIENPAKIDWDWLQDQIEFET